MISNTANFMLAAFLLAVILYDLRFMKLPNWLALTFVALFVVAVAWTLPLDVLAWRVGIAVCLLLIDVAANAARLLGGGDVKILSALVLFIPTGQLLSFVFIFCLCMIGGILVILAVRKSWTGAQTGWRGLHETGRYPMGISIGAAGLVFLALTRV